MRVLIPGITGALGQLVARRLAERGHEVVGIDRRSWPDAPPGVEVHQVDIRKRAAEDVFRKARPQAVVHMATVTHLLARSEDRYRINLGGTRAVFEHSATYGVEHVVFVGRHTFYGAAPDAPLYHAEDEPPMGLSHFPELADLVAADLYASNAIWQKPQLVTTVLRMCYTLGTSGHGTLASFLRPARIPTILGFDPLFQFMHEKDSAAAIALAVEKQPRGVFNVTGPQPVPLSILIREAGRSQIPLPEGLFSFALGRFGLPKLPRGALDHIKYPVVMDGSRYLAATGFSWERDEVAAIASFREAFPPLRGRALRDLSL